MDQPLGGTARPLSARPAENRVEEYPSTVEDASTGARITFLERGVDEQGAYLLVEGVLPGGGDGGPARLHPHSEARSEVVNDRAVVAVHGEERVLSPGESIVIPPSTAHTIRNGEEGPLVVRTTLRPPGEYEAAIRALYGLGAGGQSDLFEVAAVLYHYREDIRLASVPWRLQRPILRVLATIANALGRAPT